MNPTIDASYCCDPWYAIHCKPRKEFYAANALRSMLGLSVFLPEIKTTYRGAVRHVPFFPGYLFAHADLQIVSLSCINATPGVQRLVEFGGDPACVPLSIIQEIVERMNSLNSIEAHSSHSFHPGDRLQMKTGSLKDLEMVFVGPMTPSKRVCVLLHFLGRVKEVKMDPQHLVKLSVERIPQHERGERVSSTNKIPT